MKKQVGTLIAEKLLPSLIRAWLMVITLTLILSVIRVGQLSYFWPANYHSQLSDVFIVIFQGFRFDLKVSAIIGFLMFLILPWISNRVGIIIFKCVAFAYVMLSLVNLHYFGFYKTPIDSLIFGLLEDDTKAVLQTIWHDFPVVSTLALGIVLSMVAVALYRWLVIKMKPDTLLSSKHGLLQIFVLIFLLLALIFAGKGTLRAMALQRQHLTVTNSQFLNDMVPNGVIALNYAWGSRSLSRNLKNPLAGLNSMGFDSPQAAAAVLGLPHENEAQIKNALSTHEPLPKNVKKKNLLFFLMESWSAEPLLYQAPNFDVLGRLAPTMDKACHFSNFDSAQGGTHPTLEAILFSSPITPLTQGEIGRKPIPWSLPAVIREAGYRTVFVTSARSGWRDLNRVLITQGFDEVVDANTLKELYPDADLGIWGVWDSYVFKYLNKRMSERSSDKPIFVFVLTSTNHPPYDLPADYQRVPRDMSLWRGEKNSETLLPNLDSFHYAADQLGAFVQNIKNGPRYSDTIIAATGDHNVRSFGIYAEPERRYLMRQVPFVIWGEGFSCGDQQKLPASHRDMFNTLLPLAGIEGKYINTGRDLLRPIKSPADPLNAPRTLYFAGEARNAKGQWILGNKSSFTCSPQLPVSADCEFSAIDDLQERARHGLLDWNVRGLLKK